MLGSGTIDGAKRSYALRDCESIEPLTRQSAIPLIERKEAAGSQESFAKLPTLCGDFEQRSQIRIILRHVRLYLASAGNCFMREIAETFANGFQSLGLDARLEFDAVPVPAPLTLNVVVAPHEFLPLVLKKSIHRDKIRDIAALCYCLCTEQPGSSWFESAYSFASRCKKVFDISREGVREFRLRGILAHHAPLGFSDRKSLAETADNLDANSDRDIDILFLGRATQRRREFLAKHAELLSTYNCRLLLDEADRPRPPGTPGFVSGSARDALLRRTKVLLNLHADNRPYLEWHRALAAIENGAVFLSEASNSTEPLVNGEHAVFSDAADLMERCQELLRDETRRRSMTARADRLLLERLTPEIGCQAILEAAREDRGPALSLAARTCSRLRRTVLGSARSRLFRLRNARASLRCFLRDRSRAAHRVGELIQSFSDRPNSKRAEIRRRRIVKALDQAHAANGQSTPGFHEVTCNSAWKGVAEQRSWSPDISVVVSHSNGSQQIVSCLTSVERSDRTGLPNGIELLVVDDGATDGASEVAMQALSHFCTPGCLIRKAKETGLAESRNLGIRLSRANLVFFLDANAFLYYRSLTKLARTLRDHKADAVYGAIHTVRKDAIRRSDLTSCYAWHPARLVAAPYIDGMALYRRDRLLKVGGYSEDLIRHGTGWEEYDLWLKFAEAGFCCWLCPEIVGGCEVDGGTKVPAMPGRVERLNKHLAQKFADLAARVDREAIAAGLPLSPLQFQLPRNVLTKAA